MTSKRLEFLRVYDTRFEWHRNYSHFVNWNRIYQTILCAFTHTDLSFFVFFSFCLCTCSLRVLFKHEVRISTESAFPLNLKEIVISETHNLISFIPSNITHNDTLLLSLHRFRFNRQLLISFTLKSHSLTPFHQCNPFKEHILDTHRQQTHAWEVASLFFIIKLIKLYLFCSTLYIYALIQPRWLHEIMKRV